MNPVSTSARASAFATLRRLAQRRPEGEQCEFCGAPLGSGHRHLLETAARRIVCACDPCALRCENVIGRWKLIPRDARRLRGFQMSDAQWEALALPINLAFLFHSTAANKVMALYPSPRGATESLLPLSGWQELAAANPALVRMEPDVEALLVNRLDVARSYYIAPIGRCFELAGLIRLHWRGFSGGDRVWREIDHLFTGLNGHTAAAAIQPEVTHA